MAAPTAFHGLMAYRGKNPVEQAQAIERLRTGQEICVADRPIGPVGVVVQGLMSWAFDRDVWSSVGDDGTRVVIAPETEWGLYNPDALSIRLPNNYRWQVFAMASLAMKEKLNWLYRRGDFTGDEIVRDFEDLRISPPLDEIVKTADLTNFLNSREFVSKTRQYSEGWMRLPRIVGVWVKEWVPTDRDHPIRRQVAALERLYGPAITVTGTTRIWDVHPDHAAIEVWDRLYPDTIDENLGSLADVAYEFEEKFL